MRISDWSSDVCASDLRISGGSRETEENELIVMPQLRPEASRAVTTVTPVAKQPRARRKVRESQDRKSVVEGKSVAVRVDLGGHRIIKKKKKTKRYSMRIKETRV